MAQAAVAPLNPALPADDSSDLQTASVDLTKRIQEQT